MMLDFTFWWYFNHVYLYILILQYSTVRWMELSDLTNLQIQQEFCYRRIHSHYACTTRYSKHWSCLMHIPRYMR
jgi:hypothetical protein